MKETTEIARVESGDLLQTIANAVAKLDAGQMEIAERLLKMHEQIADRTAKVAYQAAMARLQERLPQIGKDARIVVKGTERSRYATLESIDAVIRPLLAQEGFSFSFDSQSQDGKLFVITATLSHREGHSETKSIVLPMDQSDYRSNVQSIGSTVSYAKRQLIKMHLNLIEADEDNDGFALITPDQVKDLETQIQDAKANKVKFLEYMDVDSLEQIQVCHLAKAHAALGAKRKAK